MSNDPPPYYPPQQGYPVSSAPNVYTYTTTTYPPAPGQPYPQSASSAYPPITSNNYSPNYGATAASTTVTFQPNNVVFVGGCPACRVGILEEEFTLCGVILAVLFFPLGILCCLAMRQRRCPNCGAIFG